MSGRGERVRGAVVAVAAFVAALALGAAAAGGRTPAAAGGHDPVEPYGSHDAGGFRNVLPAGEAGTDNAAQLALFELDGTPPPHFSDQLPLYEGLLGASAHRGFAMAQVARYFKDATFGVPAGDVESSISPEPGLVIERDAGYGVPHVYGQTRADVMFGAGYAAAQDRLFLMDVLRHAARARLSSFVGGGASNREMDRLVWQNLPYTDADLEAQTQGGIRRYGAAGRRVLRDARAYVAGVNAYIDAARADPTMLPAEYTAIGKLPEPWHLTDSVALAGLIGLEQGQAGGREVDEAALLQALERRFGARAGRRAWGDFREANDPGSPITVRRPFPYETGNPFARPGLAMPDPGSVEPVAVGPPIPVAAKVRSSAAGQGGLGGTIGAALLHWLRAPAPDSNALLVSAAHSTTGHPIAVMGPQVDYYVPEILMEEDLHGPGIDARGAAFPGLNQYVLLGHGRDYAWSATSAESDNVDTFAEVLCRDAYHYRYRGRCRPMQKLTRTNSWTPNLADQSPAGSETLTAYRTVHGIVFARGRVGGRRVAFVHARTTYFHEADSAIGFRELNDPRYMRGGVGAFRRAVSRIDFTFNWFYLDRRHIAYQQSGWFPVRAPGTSPDFPILGTGSFDWRGYHAATHTQRLLPPAAHPHATDPRFLVSWNNKPAPRWSASDDVLAWGPVFRSQLLSQKVARATRGARRISPAQLVRAMESSATQDLRARELGPLLLRVLGRPASPPLRAAIAMLRNWFRSGAHRRDLNGDGHDEHTAAIELFDAWWPRLVQAEFGPALGKPALGRLETMIDVGTHVGGDSFFGGFWGFVWNDLRDLYGPPPRRSASRVYCGRGSRRDCRAAVQRSLLAATKVTPAELYASSDCVSDPEPACADRDTWNVVGAIDEPAFPFQNRPTFQQVVTPR